MHPSASSDVATCCRTDDRPSSSVARAAARPRGWTRSASNGRYASRWWRVRVKRALNGQTDLPQALRRERSRQSLSEKGFLQRGNEVALQPRWPWQSRLSWLKSQGGWTVRALATERNDQNGVDSFAQITGVERHYQDPMAHRRISQHRGPDLAAPGRSITAGQSPSLETPRSVRLRGQSLPRQPWMSGL